jgi:hypothetical protein
MYFPYLRCKQFELLALRELSQKLGSSRQISPVLEPVKRSPNTLERALDVLIAYNVNFTIIVNPSVGDFAGNSAGIVTLINNKLAKYNNFQLGVLINQFTNLERIDLALDEINSQKTLTLIHVGRPNDIDSLLQWAEDKEIRYNLYNETIPIRRYRGLVTAETKVILEDRFHTQPKNAAYLQNPDEFFSDEHQYFQDDGNVGFSDYLTVGSDYVESGFLPYAVAIHLTYIKQDDQTIWIRHFVSDSNRDNIDVAGKFGEALEKLMEFIDQQNIRTDAANEFREHYRNQHYPGLGSLKKLSIKNHLELLLELLA